MKLLLTLHIIQLIAETCDLKFNNYIEYPPSDDQAEYTFDLEVTHGLSMAIRNDLKKTYDPVVFDPNDGLFYQNNKSGSNCAYNLKLTNTSEQETISTVLGQHKEMLFINNQFPGPSLVVPLNSIIKINVHNHMISTILTMHWHGQIQNKTFQKLSKEF